MTKKETNLELHLEALEAAISDDLQDILATHGSSRVSDTPEKRKAMIHLLEHVFDYAVNNAGKHVTNVRIPLHRSAGSQTVGGAHLGYVVTRMVTGVHIRYFLAGEAVDDLDREDTMTISIVPSMGSVRLINNGTNDPSITADNVVYKFLTHIPWMPGDVFDNVFPMLYTE